jgi:hypothetical protein
VDNPFSNRQLWIGHLEIEHGFGPNWEDIQCPLCLEHTESGKGVVLTHFARHMEDIALAALPRGVDSDVESDSETSSRSDSFREPETTFDKDTRGIGGWLESSPAPDHAPQLEVTAEKHEATANMNSGPSTLREDQEEKSLDGGYYGAYYDPVYERYRGGDKAGVDLDSSVSRQAIESTDLKLKREAEVLCTPPARPTRNDDGTEVSGQPTLSVHKTIPGDQIEEMDKWRDEQKEEERKLHEKQNPSFTWVYPRDFDLEAMDDPWRLITRCVTCRENKKIVIESQTPVAQKAADCGSAAHTIACGRTSAKDAASSDYPAQKAQKTLSQGPFIQTDCLAILRPWILIQRCRYRLRTACPSTWILQIPPWTS